MPGPLIFGPPPRWQGGVAVGSYLGPYLCLPWAPAPRCVPQASSADVPRLGVPVGAPRVGRE